MSSGRTKRHKPESGVNITERIIDDGQQSKLSVPKNDVNENSMDDFDISATDNRGKQNLSSPFKNLSTSRSSGKKLRKKRQCTVQADLKKNIGDPDDLLNLGHSKQKKNTDANWNESNVTGVDLEESIVKVMNFDDLDFFAHGDDSLKASTPCSRKSQRTKRALKWTDDFVCEKVACTKSKRPRLSATKQMLNSSLETSDLQVDNSAVCLPLVKRTRRRKRSKMSDHEDSGASYQQELPAVSADISLNGSVPLEKEECDGAKGQTNRRRSRKASNNEQQTPLDKPSMFDSSEECNKECSCFHCGEVKENTGALKLHMAAKHHRIWTSDCPEGTLDERGSCKMLKSIRCLKCDKLCSTFMLYKNHIKWCGREDERVDCEVCGKNVRVMSYDAHVRYMHKRKSEAENVQVDEMTGENTALPAGEISTTGRSLRQAAVKARNKLRELTTDLASTKISDSHSKTQDLSSSESEASAFSSTESTDDDDDDDEDDDEDSASNAASDSSEGVSRSKTRKRYGLLPMAVFLKQHCSTNLFSNWEAKQCLYKALPASKESLYLPQNPGLAIKIQTSETEFSRTVKLDLFEAYIYKDSYNINVGGPVWALAWCPVPPGVRADQYLAVYTHRTPDETHPVNECSKETALIQLWRLPLHLQNGPESEKPEMIGGLLLDCGPIWEMKWCPTGCWKKVCTGDSQDPFRIGLLAVASHSGDVHILSVPQCFSVSSEQQHVKLYRSTPVAKLKRRGKYEISPCLCLDWHWQEECGMLMAGFADGTTSLWDLNVTSSLLRVKAEDGKDLLFPFQSIRSHVWPVKGVAFCQSQLNLLVTCSADRMVKLWDMTESESPLATYHNTLNTGVIWPVNCTNTFTCSGDDCYLCEHNGTILCYYATNKLLTRPLTVHHASVWGMSYNCWSHCLVSCDSVGVVVRVPWISPNHKSISNARQVLFVVEMCDGSAEVANCQMPSSSLSVKTEATENDLGTASGNDGQQVVMAAVHSSDDACECKCHCSQIAEPCENSKSHLVTDCKHCQLRRCLVFKDFSTEWQFSNAPIFYAKQLPVDDIHNSLPCSLNRIAWNTNYGFHKWLAAGGQAGVLRIRLIEETEQNRIKTKRKIRKGR